MLPDLISFIVECEKLKAVERRSSPVGMARRENSAEHSWSAVIAASVLIPGLAPDLDLLRVLKMLAIHDIVEIDAGDTFCYGDQTGKAEREEAAATRIFGILPTKLREEFHAIWHEFEAAETAEAKFANAIDRLLPLLQNSHNNGSSWRENKVTYEQVYERNARINDGNSELWKYTMDLIESAHQKGLLPKAK